MGPGAFYANGDLLMANMTRVEVNQILIMASLLQILAEEKPSDVTLNLTRSRLMAAIQETRDGEPSKEFNVQKPTNAVDQSIAKQLQQSIERNSRMVSRLQRISATAPPEVLTMLLNVLNDQDPA